MARCYGVQSLYRGFLWSFSGHFGCASCPLLLCWQNLSGRKKRTFINVFKKVPIVPKERLVPLLCQCC